LIGVRIAMFPSAFGLVHGRELILEWSSINLPFLEVFSYLGKGLYHRVVSSPWGMNIFKDDLSRLKTFCGIHTAAR